MANLTNKAPLERVIATTGIKVKDIPIGNGQILFVQDMQRIALDFNGNRTFYNQITELDTEHDRKNLSNPLRGYYFCIDTAVLWFYNRQWTQITEKPSEVVFIGVELPELGQENKLYVKNETGNEHISIWDTDSQGYKVVADKTQSMSVDMIHSFFNN